MNKFPAAAGLVVAGACVVWVGFGLHKNSKCAAAFDQTAVGDTEAKVISRFGRPDYREPAGKPYMRYTAAACTAPCYTRLWWEDAFIPGISAWSIEFNKTGRVTRTARWVSP